MKTFRIQAANFAATGDEPELFTVDQRRAADTLQRPVVNATGRKLRTRMLPQERSILLIEAQQNTQVDRLWIPLQVAIVVVGPDIDFAIGNNGIAIGLRTQRGGRRRGSMGRVVSNWKVSRSRTMTWMDGASSWIGNVGRNARRFNPHRAVAADMFESTRDSMSRSGPE